MLDRLGNRPRLLLLLFAGIYFVGFSLIASKGVISNDELFTLYIARLPHFRDVWAALATGAEQTPPLFYAVSRADIKLFGTSGLALRLPEMLAFFLMGAVLFHIVARRTSPVYGFLALLFPFMTTAFNYVFEARAYALVLCFSVTGLLCWIWATEGRHRVPALVGLALSLAAAISSHYYAVLSLFPIGLGEAVRTFRRKKIDVGVWLALLLSLSPLVAFLPLIESARKFAPHFWSKPHWSSIVYFYDYFLLTPSVIPLLAILLVVVASSVFRKPAEDTSEAGTLKSVPEHEIAGVLGFLMIPAVGIVLAKTAVGAFSARRNWFVHCDRLGPSQCVAGSASGGCRAGIAAIGFPGRKGSEYLAPDRCIQGIAGINVFLSRNLRAWQCTDRDFGPPEFCRTHLRPSSQSCRAFDLSG